MDPITIKDTPTELILSAQPTGAPVGFWKKKYEAGCEWCGQKYPSLNKNTSWGYPTYGLQYCHIFADGLAPAHEWNGFILCPHCHTIFDKVVKPRLQIAFVTAISGFGEQPTNSKKSYVVGHTYKDCVEALIKKNKKAAATLPAELNSRLTPWANRK
jgi:hypothetical protein